MSFIRTSLLLTALSFTVLADQHQDDEAGLFFMRVEWWPDGFDLPAFRNEFETVAADLQIQWQLKVMSEVPRVAIFVQGRRFVGQCPYVWRVHAPACAAWLRASRRTCRFPPGPNNTLPIGGSGSRLGRKSCL